jgi:hypothetical protein
MTEEQLKNYRAISGLQLQYAQDGDKDGVMRMQEALEKYIGDCVRIELMAALSEMKAHPIKPIVCNMTKEEITAYRMMQGDGIRFFTEDGFEGRRGFEDWKAYQIGRVEAFVSGLIEQRVLDAVKPFLTIRVN